jgi:hypothetical protein
MWSTPRSQKRKKKKTMMKKKKIPTSPKIAYLSQYSPKNTHFSTFSSAKTAPGPVFYPKNFQFHPPLPTFLCGAPPTHKKRKKKNDDDEKKKSQHLQK